MSVAGNSIRSLATESYNTAAKRFITRDFDECWTLLKPLADKCLQLVSNGEISVNTRSKLWILYAALADAAPDLAITISWDTIRKGYESFGDVEPSVMLAVSQVVLKDLGNTKATADAIEEYISLQNSLDESDRPLVALLVTEILPSLGDYEYARGFTEDCSIFDANTKLQIKDSLNKREISAKEAREREEKHRLELEQQQKEQEEQTRLDAVAAQVAETTVCAENIVSKDHKRPLVNRQPIKPHTSLPNLWKSWLLSTIRSRGFTNGLLTVIFLLTLATNLRVRRRLASSSRWVWESAKQAAVMAVTVTYF